jgi:hypothetical protein
MQKPPLNKLATSAPCRQGLAEPEPQLLGIVQLPVQEQGQPTVAGLRRLPSIAKNAMVLQPSAKPRVGNRVFVIGNVRHANPPQLLADSKSNFIF